jgi:hypothetical protein
VPGPGILVDVVLDAIGGQGTIKSLTGAAERPVLIAVAGEDRAGLSVRSNGPWQVLQD